MFQGLSVGGLCLLASQRCPKARYVRARTALSSLSFRDLQFINVW